MKMVLKKDMVIKAGTVFERVYGETRKYVDSCYSASIGLTNDSYGESTYGIDFNEKDPFLKEWFEVYDGK